MHIIIHSGTDDQKVLLKYKTNNYIHNGYNSNNDDEDDDIFHFVNTFCILVYSDGIQIISYRIYVTKYHAVPTIQFCNMVIETQISMYIYGIIILSTDFLNKLT